MKNVQKGKCDLSDLIRALSSSQIFNVTNETLFFHLKESVYSQEHAECE